MKLSTPRFRLRTIFLLIALFSAVLASVVISAKRQAKAVRNIEAFRSMEKGTSIYGPGRLPVLGYRHQREGRLGEPQEAQFKYWMRNWFGNEHFGDVVTVQLDNTEFGDRDLESLVSLPSVEFLRLANTRSTDAGLELLNQCEKTEFLALNNTEISDEGLKQLRKMPHLRRLSIANTPVTDKGVPVLASLDNLQELWLRGTAISEDGFQVSSQRWQTLSCLVA